MLHGCAFRSGGETVKQLVLLAVLILGGNDYSNVTGNGLGQTAQDPQLSVVIRGAGQCPMKRAAGPSAHHAWTFRSIIKPEAPYPRLENREYGSQVLAVSFPLARAVIKALAHLSCAGG